MPIPRPFHLLRRLRIPPAPGGQERPGPGRGTGIAVLHLLVLACLAVAQPLLNLLGQYPEFFVARRAEPWEIVLLAAFLVLALPLPLVLLEVLAARLGRRAQAWTHGVLVALLLAVIAQQLANRVAPRGGAELIAVAVLGGALGALLYARFAPLRLFVTLLSPVLLLSPALFLAGGPMRELVFAGPERANVVHPLPIRHPAPVVFVIFDELSLSSLLDREGNIDGEVFPNFRRLAESAHWFRNATTVADLTSIAVPAIVSGKYPVQRLPPTAEAYPDTLFRLLQGNYRLSVQEFRTDLCPPLACALEGEAVSGRLRSLAEDSAVVLAHVVAPPAWAAELPPITLDWRDFIEDKRRDRPDRVQIFRRFVESLKGDVRPTLHYLHVGLPHVPYKYLPDGSEYRDTTIPGLSNEQWGADSWAVKQGLQRYLLQLSFVDSLLGELLDALQSRALYDEALLVVTADHGVSFLPNEKRRPLTAGNYAEILPVPLFVKLPGQRQGVASDRNVESIDILPTVAEVLGLDLPFAADGRSLLREGGGQRREKRAMKGANRKTLRFPHVFAEKKATRERMERLFPATGGPERWYRLGPHTELIGRLPGEIGLAPPAPVSFQLSGSTSTLLLDYRPGGAYVASHLTGHLKPQAPTRKPFRLAVAVNGTVRSVTRTFRRKRNLHRFSAFVPPEAFRAGRNTVELYVVSRRKGGGVRLAPVDRPAGAAGADAARYRLATGKGAPALQDPAGRPIRFVEGAVEGWVDARKRGKGWVRFDGWAFDGKAGGPAKALLLFVQGHFVLSGTTGIVRNDVVGVKGAGALKAGFSLYLTEALAGDACFPGVRVFALSAAGVASELNYSPALRCDR